MIEASKLPTIPAATLQQQGRDIAPTATDEPVEYTRAPDAPGIAPALTSRGDQ